MGLHTVAEHQAMGLPRFGVRETAMESGDSIRKRPGAPTRSRDRTPDMVTPLVTGLRRHCEMGNDPIEADASVAELIRAEREPDRQCARLFLNAVKDGNAEALLSAVDALNNLSVDGWRLAMLGVGRLAAVSDEVRAAFLNVWIESKSVSLRAFERPTLVRALRVLLPGNYRGSSLQVYRGTKVVEHRRRTYGFSWTTSRSVAERFANEQERKALAGRDARLAFSYASARGIVLATTVLPEAVLLKREPEDSYDEEEVVIDPYRLTDVTIVPSAGGEFIPENGGGAGVRLRKG